MKIDIKSWLIIALLVFSMIFFGIWYFDGTGSKSKIKELNAQIEVLAKNRQAELDSIKVLKEQYLILEKASIDKEKQINYLDSTNKVLSNKSASASAELSKLRKKLKETQDKIRDLENNPIIINNPDERLRRLQESLSPKNK